MSRLSSPGLIVFLVIGLVVVPTPLPAVAPLPPTETPLSPEHARNMARGQELFRTHVRGILTNHCVKCHGGDKTRGGLDMTTRTALLKGGDNGPVIFPGKGKDSRLFKLAAHLDDPHMPPKGSTSLDQSQLAHLLTWIDLGAPYDKPLLDKVDPATKKEMIVGEEDRRFWSFRPLQRPALPVTKGTWGHNAIDRFILAGLEARNLTPTPEADRRTLLRRAYFDLIGLPPSPEEIDAFVADRSPDAWEKVIDRLLASPHYGERWARHWLDVVRFGESHGFEHDYDRPTAYHYRDFVIKALQQDLPYDTFVRWQLAGDELAPDDPLALTATGFLAAGVHSTQITINQVEKERYDELDDIVRTMGTAFLGLTVGCARCHDHKYDPIPTRDYYRLVSTFTTTVRTEVDVPVGPQGTGKVKALICSEGLKPIRLHSQGADFLQHTHFLTRGDPNQKKEIATPGYLQVLLRGSEGEKRWQESPPVGWRTSYKRRALAHWITDVEHGAGQLLARVIVNRLWQHLLGAGIVATPGDFGYQGERPTHPELLDHLACELIRGGWRLKPILEQILLSATYRQGTHLDKNKAAIDPDNRFLWRRLPRRLEAEVLRDSLLAVGGRLETRMFGPGTLDPKQRRRSIYFFVKRSQLIPMMVLFDAPDGTVGIDARTTTTIAPQALLLMNNEVVRDSARGLAERAASAKSPAEAVTRAYRIALGRKPSTAELLESVAFLEEQTRSYREQGRADPGRAALVDFAQVLLGCNEFIYID